MLRAERLTVTAPETLERWPCEVADPRAQDVIVRTQRSLISPGTELRILQGRNMAAAVWAEASDLELVTAYEPGAAPRADGGGNARFPATLGYNSVGVVESTGEDVNMPRAGQRVMTLARHQSHYRVRAWESIAVPDGVSTDHAAFAYLATLGLHALRQAGYLPGHRVAVLGAGVVGALAALVAAAVGAAQVAVVEPRAGRRDRLNGIAGITPLKPEAAETTWAASADVVIDAAGGAPALTAAMRLVAPGGAIAVVALHPEPLGALFDGHLFAKQVRVFGCANGAYADPATRPTEFTIPRTVAYTLELLHRGVLDVDRLITHRLPAARAAEGYAALADPDSDACGVLLDWTNDGAGRG